MLLPFSMSMGLCPARASRAREPRYKLVKSTTSLVMHIISVTKALKNIPHIYISYTVRKKYKRRMHEKFPSLHRGSYKANLLKMAELDGERNFFQGLILIE